MYPEERGCDQTEAPGPLFSLLYFKARVKVKLEIGLVNVLFGGGRQQTIKQYPLQTRLSVIELTNFGPVSLDLFL